MSGGIERRSSVRKVIRMACVVRFSSGIEINGVTQNVSLNGVGIEASSVGGPSKRIPTPGEMGLLTLKFRHGGAPDSMMVQCQVMHILGNGMGLSAQFSDLNKREQDMLGTMLASGRPQIDEVIDAA
ncbi:MAG: PilZ domain-containing protein [Gammaproteobacteria bacterium]|nr:PilZ domain-containing protein [Gammaproteobacteria bacterium]